MDPHQVVAHSHAGPTEASRTVRWFLGVLMTVLMLGTAMGAGALWPRDASPRSPWLDPGASLVNGTVVGVVVDDGASGHLVVRLDNGTTVNVPAEPSAPLDEARVGQGVKVITLPDQADAYFFDYERGLPLLLLALGFVTVVAVVARWKGVAALAGLATALTVVWTFTLPALASGRNPLQVALVTAAIVMFVVVYLAHGVSVKTTTALLGTFVGIAVVATLAWWAIAAASLTPLQDEVMGQLPSQFPGIDARGILLCGMVLAGVGILNDVTITQASTVWELRTAAPEASRRSIYRQAMRVGRDHIASTVYTIAFAYVGTALAMLLLASRLDFTIIQLLTFNTIAEEVVATLVASTSLVATIPLTTALAAWLARPRTATVAEESRRAMRESSLDGGSPKLTP
ncbi:MAG TPA: YibE/F family protein [Propionicimonas sp.]